MGKSDMARSAVARAVLRTPKGAQIPTTPELAREAGTSAGTVHAALKDLEGSGALTTTAHGGKGRVLLDYDPLALWRAGDRGTLTGVLPLPESREFSGIATALTDLASEANVPLQLLFRQGNAVRMKAVSSGLVDFTLMSQAARFAEGGEFAAMDLGAHSYYGQNSLVIVTEKGSLPSSESRVAVDPGSSDHVSLTRSAFPSNPRVEMPYMSIPEAIVSGVADAAIWHRTTSSPLLVAVGIDLHETDSVSFTEPDSIDRASLIWRQGDEVGKVLNFLFPVGALEKIQAEVVSGTRSPSF